MKSRKFWTALTLTSLLLLLSVSTCKTTTVLLPDGPRILHVLVHEDGTKTYEVNEAFILEYRRMRLLLQDVVPEERP